MLCQSFSSPLFIVTFLWILLPILSLIDRAIRIRLAGVEGIVACSSANYYRRGRANSGYANSRTHCLLSAIVVLPVEVSLCNPVPSERILYKSFD